MRIARERGLVIDQRPQPLLLREPKTVVGDAVKVSIKVPVIEHELEKVDGLIM